MNKIHKIFGIVLYAAAALLFMFAVWATISCGGIIAEAIEYGQLRASGDEFTIVNFYLTNGSQFFVFSLIVAALGMILHKEPETAAEIETETEIEEEEEIEEETAGE